MRAREDTSKQHPCVYCGVGTVFERDVRGPRGALLKWEPCCVTCGEHPALRVSKSPDKQPVKDSRPVRARRTGIKDAA